MPLYVKDEAVAHLVAELATARGLTKQDAVRLAVRNQLDQDARSTPLRDRIASWRTRNPLPPATGQRADKAFFDDLSGET